MAKLIIAFIRSEKLEQVKKALEDIGMPGLTIFQVYGRGEEKGMEITYRGKPLHIDLIPRIQLEVIVDNDDRVNDVVEAIARAACTGKPGDGRIIVIPLEANIKVRNYCSNQES